jgi:hypothetical protein
MKWLENPVNVLIIAGTILIALFAVLYAIQHGLKLKLEKGALTAEDSVDTTVTTHSTTASAATLPCDAYQHDHMVILTELRDTTRRIDQSVSEQAATLSTQDEILGSLVAASKLSLKRIMEEKGQLQPGEEINGDLRDAYDEVKQAETLYKGMRKVVGGT